MAVSERGTELYEAGLRAVDSGNYGEAFSCLCDALKDGVTRTPAFDCAFAVCLAAQQKREEALNLCMLAIEEEPCVSGHYLQLGRIYLLSQMRKDAIRAFREGMLYRRDSRIVAELQLLGIRRRPFFDALPRGHLLNRIAGRLLDRFIKD